MEWWYKTNKYDVNVQNMRLLTDVIMKELTAKGNLRIANLYVNGSNFYIKTTNNITLHTFLFIHGFEEIYHVDDLEVEDLGLLFGTQE